MIEKDFKLHKIFKKNTVKVSYSCTQNICFEKIVKKETQESLDCNCRFKADCPLNGNYRKESVIYKCSATTCDSKELYLGLKEGEFKKQWYYGPVKYFRNKFYASSTTLLSYVCEMKNATPVVTWEILRTAKVNSNITKTYSLCLHEKLAIITYPYPGDVLNRQSKLVTKRRYENKFQLKTLPIISNSSNSND